MNANKGRLFGTALRPWLTPMAGITLLVTLAAGLWRAHDVTAQEDRQREAVVSAELQSLRRDIKRMEAVDRQRSVSIADVHHDAQKAGSQAHVLAPAEDEHPKQPPDEEQQRAAAQARHQELVASVEARFASEDVDQEWRATTVGQIKDVLSASTPGTRLVEADCASSICRAVVVHDNDEARRNLASEIASSEPFNHGVLYSYDYESEPPKTTLFVRREGTTFGEDGQGP